MHTLGSNDLIVNNNLPDPSSGPRKIDELRHFIILRFLALCRSNN